jgi:type II secretory pathway component PulK
MRYRSRTASRRPRRGVALIAVLVVVAILALAAYRFSDLMQAEAQAADSYTRSLQARAGAESGLAYVAAVLANDPTGQNILNGNPYDNPGMFQGVLLHDDNNPRHRLRFSIVSPLGPDDLSTTSGGGQTFAYGVNDEAGKININALFKLDKSGQTLYNTLMQLPNMTDDVANSIIYWIDPTATQRSSGATDEYYTSLNPPYHAKNAPLDSIEELLLVRGVTPQLLYGNDTTRSGQADPSQGEGTAVDQGWMPYLTMYSREQNVDSNGNPRIWVNDPDIQSLQSYLTNAGFDDAISSFIIAYRMYGPASSGGGSGAGGTGTGGTGPGGTGAGGTGATGTGAGGMGGTGAGGMGGTGASGAKQGTTASAIIKTPAGGTTTITTGRTVTSTGNDTDDTTGATAGGGAKASGGGGTGTATGATKMSTQRLMRGNLGNVQSQGGGQTIPSLYALINAKVTIPASSPQDQPTTYASPMSDSGSIAQYLPQILDQLTTSKAANLPARINVNTAPMAVLSALSTGSSSGSTPILDPGTVQTILATRPQYSAGAAADPIFQTPAWLITQANLPVSTVQQLDQYVTARSQVYRFQVVGHFDGGGATARVEAVVDLNAGRPRIVYFRDLTALGKGFDLPKNN